MRHGNVIVTLLVGGLGAETVLPVKHHEATAPNEHVPHMEYLIEFLSQDNNSVVSQNTLATTMSKSDMWPKSLSRPQSF